MGRDGEKQSGETVEREKKNVEIEVKERVRNEREWRENKERLQNESESKEREVQREREGRN